MVVMARRNKEKKNPLVDNDYDLIYYSDFTDLKMIFEKGKNYKEIFTFLKNHLLIHIISRSTLIL